MKKFIYCIVALLLLITAIVPFAASAADGQPPVFSASKITVCPGDNSVDVSIRVSNNSGFASATIDLVYDSTVLQLESLNNNNFDGLEVKINNAKTRIVASGGSNADSNATVADLTFKIVNATEGEKYSIGITVHGVYAIESNGKPGDKPISVVSNDGLITVDHQFTNYVSNNDATCKEDGTKTATCDLCGEAKDTIADVGSKKDHQFTNYVSNNDATCKADGTKTATCDLCGEAKDTIADVGSKKDHQFTNYVSNNDATCKADGTKTAKCDLCDEAEDTIVDVGSSSLIPHTDDDQDGVCDVCDKNLGSSCAHPSKTTHYSIDKEPTCNEPGFGTTWVRCAACGCTLSKESYLIPATNKHVDENKDGKCDVCGKSLVTEHVHELEHVEAKAATCTENGNIEYWYCAGCDSYFTDAEGKNKVDAADVVVPAAHKVEHVPAKEATETEDGNIEYWHCPECGGIWLDADCTTAAKLEDVVIPATGHVHNLVYTAAKEATCFEEGNLEYWYCEGCNCYFTDAEGKYNIAYLSIILPVAHKVEHVAAKAPTCFEEGNIEYWYCTECGYAWLDELCTKNTNLLAVILPVSHKIVHVEAKAPTATEEGNIEYWYCTECGYAWLDELCTKNTNLKAVILPATGEDINPPTGDATILYIAAVAVIATLGVAVISFKKREEN